MSELIPLQQAVEMTTLYRKEKENILAPEYRNKNILANCETFDRSDIDTILAAQDCVKLRIYYGMDASLQIHAIIVAVNSKDEDILPSSGKANEAATSTDGHIGEESTRCPPFCPPPSPLNGG